MLMVRRHSSAKQFKRIATGKYQFVKLIDMVSLSPLWFQFQMKPFETIRNHRAFSVSVWLLELKVGIIKHNQITDS